MIEQLRGRNLAHVGCTVGLVLGLVLGMFLALLVLAVVSSADWATAAWLGLTFAMGGLGYIVGDRGSRRLWERTSPKE